MREEIVRLGLIGPGKWGRNFLTTASEMSGLSVSCVCRASRTSVEGFAGVLVTDDVDELFSACDAVIVSTPPESHADLSIRALRAGRPVMVEKPASLDHGSVSRMLSAAKEAGLPLLVDHIHLFSPAFCVLREWTREWSVRKVSSLSGANGPFRDYSPLYDWGPHDLSMCLSLFMATPVDLDASVSPSERGEMFDVFFGFGESFANLRFGNGLSQKTKVFSVSSAEGEARYDGSSQSLEFKGKSISFSATTPLREALSVFRKVVLGGEDWRCDPWLCLETSRILDEVRRVTATRSAQLPPPR